MQNRQIAKFWKIEELIQGLRMDLGPTAPLVLFWDADGKDSDAIHISAACGDSLILVCRKSLNSFNAWKDAIGSEDGITLFWGRLEFAP